MRPDFYHFFLNTDLGIFPPTEDAMQRTHGVFLRFWLIHLVLQQLSLSFRA